MFNMQNSAKTFRHSYGQEHRPAGVCFIFCLLVTSLFYLTAAIKTATAATYYVATTGNDSTGAGTFASPWLTINYGVSQLSAGDTLNIRGGIYRETVIMSVTGTSENRITIQNYNSESVTLTGAEALTGWTQCQSSTVGLKDVDGTVNVNYSNIYYADIADTQVADVNELLLFEGSDLLAVAQTPKQTESLLTQGRSEYWAVPNEGSNFSGQQTTIADSTNLTQASDDYWHLADSGNITLKCFVNQYDNSDTRIRTNNKVIDFVTSTDTITFEATGVNFASSDRYTILNHPTLITQAGEYYYRDLGDGNHRVYVWPVDSDNLTANMGVLKLENAIKQFNTNQACFVTVKGINVIGYAPLSTAGALIWSRTSDGLILDGITLKHINSHAIYLKSSSNAIVQDCIIDDVSAAGVSVNYTDATYCVDTQIIDNTFTRCGSSSIYINGCDGMIIRGNTVGPEYGPHNSGITIYGLNSQGYYAENVLVAHNTMPYVRCRAMKNVYIYGNRIISDDGDSPIALWAIAESSGELVIANNACIEDGPGMAVYVNATITTLDTLIIKNNIFTSLNPYMDNFCDSDESSSRSNNLYLDSLPENGISGTGSVDATSAAWTDIFTSVTESEVSIENDDYTLVADSPAIGAGVSVQSDLPVSDANYTNFSGWTKDYAGTSWVANPAIGAYEYISQGNNAPVLQAIDNTSVDENSSLSFSVSATDADGDTITYTATGLPSGATFANQTFSWTPGYTQAGTYQVTFVASDGQAQDSETITITVSNINRAPVLTSIGDKSVNENALLSFSVSAADEDGDEISYSVQTLPSGAVFGNQTFTWTPGYTQAGTHQVTFTASDGTASDSETITITVNNTNQPPVLGSVGNKSVYTEDSLTFIVSATDPDGDTITYSAAGLPSGATFANHTFSWTPSNSQAGSYDVTFTASDSQTQDSETITITVTADTSAPTVTNLSPAADSIQTSLNSLIYLDITDSGKGVNASTVTIEVNSNLVYTGNTTDYSSSYGHCRRTGTGTAYTYIYQADEMFDYDQTVTVVANATDLSSNSMAEYSYSFKTEMRSFGENKKVNSSSNNLNDSSPATVSDSSGNIWAVWHTGQTGSRDIYAGKLTAGADSFGDSVRVTNDNADQCNPAIAIDSADKLYVVWQDNRNGEWDIYVSTSTDGTNFSAERKVTDPNSDQINPAVVIDSSDKAYIVWEDDRNNNKDIYTASSSNSFVSYATSQITSNASDQIAPAVAVDSGNTVYVVWTDARSGTSDIYGADSTNGPWTNVAVVSNANNQSSPVIAAEASGTILHLLWVDNTSGNNDIYYASSNGLPGSPLNGSSIIDDDSGADQSAPVITTTGSTGNDLKVFACWKDGRNISSDNGDTDIYFVEANSGSGTNVLVGDDGTNSAQSYPAMGTDGYGYPYLVWTDDRNTATNIYYAGSTFVESTALESEDITASSGATVGTELASINSATDVSVTIPVEACSHDATITISRIKNPPKLTLDNLGTLYEFGPSGIEFDYPVTIIIPYDLSTVGNSPSAYWYNPLTSVLSQQGITDIETVEISSTLYALRFKTTHFTQFLVGGDIAATAGEGGGGGGLGLSCSMSPNSQGSIVEFLLPYIGLTVVMTILKLRDRRKNKMHDIAKSE